MKFSYRKYLKLVCCLILGSFLTKVSKKTLFSQKTMDFSALRENQAFIVNKFIFLNKKILITQ
jgi:hypothetical protein